jgi:hypothetical protein
MSAHRSTLAQLLISFAVCLLFCTIISAEVPELMSLTDNASNDFTIHKTVNREFAQTLNAVAHTPVLLGTEPSECTTCASFPASTETPSSPLFLLHSVLRT